jgi:hypothetical protein
LPFALALALIAFPALRAAADPGILFLPKTAGQLLHYHLAHTVQTPTGPQTTSTNVDLVRRAGGTVVIERTGPDGTPNLAVLVPAADGSLHPEDARAAAADGGLTDLLAGLNLAIAATREGDATAGGTWLATIAIAAPPAAASVPVVLVPSVLTGTDFDFSGTGQVTAGTTSIVVHVEGHAGNARAVRIAITQTRTITVANMPFVNVGSWSIAVAP